MTAAEAAVSGRRRPGSPRRMPRLTRRLSWFQLLAVLEVALLARRHLQALTPAERRRLTALLSHPHHLSRSERQELRRIAAKLDLRAFATGAADKFSPVPVPGRRPSR
jgi:hypothetical protein